MGGAKGLAIARADGVGRGVNTDILIIGAGPAGLAVAGSLAGRGLQAVIIEKAGDIGSSWRGHYDRLRLHTVKQESALPGMLS